MPGLSRASRRECDVVSQMTITLLVQTHGGHAQTEEAGVIARHLVFDRGEIQKVLVYDFAQLRILLPRRTAADAQHLRHLGIAQAFAQNALSDHAGCAEDNDSHRRSGSQVCITPL